MIHIQTTALATLPILWSRVVSRRQSANPCMLLFIYHAALQIRIRECTGSVSLPASFTPFHQGMSRVVFHLYPHRQKVVLASIAPEIGERHCRVCDT